MSRPEESLPLEPFESDFDKMKPEYRSQYWFFGLVNSQRRLNDLWGETRTWQSRLAVLLPWLIVLGVIVAVVATTFRMGT